MALANYTDLQAAVANWLQRSDLTSYIPDFIALCETKISRYLRTLEIQSTATTSPMAETNTLPSDFMELQNIAVSYSGISLTPAYITPDAMDGKKGVTPTTQGPPQFFTIRLGKTEYFPAPNAGTTYTETLTYYKRIVALATTPTNWLLTGYPDIYLYGSLLEATAFSRDDPRIGLWKSAYDAAIRDLERADDRKRFFKAGATVSLGLPGTNGRPSIESGFF